MFYQATHTTRYLYEQPVSQCQSEARLTPRSFARQRLIRNRIQTRPEPAVFSVRRDYFGNEVTAFAVMKSHDRLVTTATSLVEVLPRPDEELPSISWETASRLISEAPDSETLEASEYLYNSPFVEVRPELADLARPSFTPGRSLAEAVVELSARIHADFQYEPHSTSIDMPLIEVLEQRRGVCQDFAHVLIGALRSLHLAARYVSGYLRSGAEYQGAEASHAWAAAYIPGYGWLDVDPTNNVIPSEGHVTLAWGRDFGDVTPVKGIALGGGEQRIEVEVRVDEVSGGREE
jgi:transglutaminase-like putative cysteine protease